MDLLHRVCEMEVKVNVGKNKVMVFEGREVEVCDSDGLCSECGSCEKAHTHQAHLCCITINLFFYLDTII